MAINVKNIIASALLELCETKSLEALTVKQILEKSGVSRQTFYNHFLDKNDLIVSNFSIPFCNKNHFNDFWLKIVNSINSNRILCR